jgi:8-oxo-dGTP pyrophosphatase MutT (NUDIX family)
MKIMAEAENTLSRKRRLFRQCTVAGRGVPARPTPEVPMTTNNPPRRSQAALAVVCRPGPDGAPLWLAQWNAHWQRYHFVGGHRRPDETFRQCLLREIAEELHLTEGTDFEADEQPLAHVEYVAWSERHQAETQYEMELYRVRLLGENVLERIQADPLNRWLSADEIRAGRTADGQPVNETMARLLGMGGAASAG